MVKMKETQQTVMHKSTVDLSESDFFPCKDNFGMQPLFLLVVLLKSAGSGDPHFKTALYSAVFFLVSTSLLICVSMRDRWKKRFPPFFLGYVIWFSGILNANGNPNEGAHQSINETDVSGFHSSIISFFGTVLRK